MSRTEIAVGWKHVEFWKGEWPNPVGHLVVGQGDIERLETLPEEITAAKEALSKHLVNHDQQARCLSLPNTLGIL